MAKLTLDDIASGYNLNTVYNDNNTAIETALENTLSRDGTAPNTMGADLDMNSNDILNAGTVEATAVTVGGVDYVAAAAASAAAASTSETNAGASEVAAAASESAAAVSEANAAQSAIDAAASAAAIGEGTDLSSTGATDGYVLTADGAGAAAWEAVSGGLSAAAAEEIIGGWTFSTANTQFDYDLTFGDGLITSYLTIQPESELWVVNSTTTGDAWLRSDSNISVDWHIDGLVDRMNFNDGFGIQLLGGWLYIEDSLASGAGQLWHDGTDLLLECGPSGTRNFDITGLTGDLTVDGVAVGGADVTANETVEGSWTFENVLTRFGNSAGTANYEINCRAGVNDNFFMYFDADGAYTGGSIGVDGTANALQIKANNGTAAGSVAISIPRTSGGLVHFPAGIDMEDSTLDGATFLDYRMFARNLSLATANAYTIAQVVTISLTTSGTLGTPSGAPGSGYFGEMTYIFTQDATGGWAVTWPASFKWPGGVAGVVDPAANAVSVLHIMTVNGGTTWLCNLVNDYS